MRRYGLYDATRGLTTAVAVGVAGFLLWAAGNSSPRLLEAVVSRYQAHVTLEPDDAFGEYDADLIRVEPRERFPKEIEVGMQFEGVPGEREEEALIYTITDITPESVVVDGNLVTGPAWPALNAWLAKFLGVLGTRIEL